MAGLASVIEQLRGLDLERTLGLRPAYPQTAIELERTGMVIVRLRAKRRGRPRLETFRVQPTEEPGAPATIFDQDPGSASALGERLVRLLELAGVRPGKISLVLPDNVAKLSLLTLPERPPSRKQLEEVIRFKTRRGVPFRIADAALSYQVLPAPGRGVNVFVALVRRALIERYEQVLEALGARPGLVDLCTPSLLNLCRARIAEASAEGDVAFINCAQTYFSLAIVRESRLAFFRCKTYSMNGELPAADGLLGRELAYSLSYYEEKLGGTGIRTLFVRSAPIGLGQIMEPLAALRAERVEPIDPGALLESDAAIPADSETAQRLAPALGAALGRG